MDSNNYAEEAKTQVITRFHQLLQQKQASKEIKNLVKDGTSKIANITSECHLSDLLPKIIEQLSENEVKVIEECWKVAKQQLRSQNEKILVPKKSKEVSKEKVSNEQEDDSFKFDSHSESYSSSYDDIDDDFRKQEMKQEEESK